MPFKTGRFYKINNRVLLLEYINSCIYFFVDVDTDEMHIYNEHSLRVWGATEF